MKLRDIFLLGLFFFFTNTVLANKKPPSWVNEGPYLEDSPASFEIPIEVFFTKLYVEIEIGGKPRRFVFDTGSPSMIDTELVKELGLKTIDTNKGIDAHGAIVETGIVQVDIRMGDTAIQKVPMMAADFSASVPTKSFIGDGVLGSDLFPLGSWQFDINNSVLRFNTNLKKLPHVKKAKKLKLYQFGYPYMPIFDVKFAKRARSKAMLDTGSPTFFAISSPDLDGVKRASGVGKILSGYGSPGQSLGGQAPQTELLKIELKNLAIDKLKLGRVAAVGRDLSPSLIGARILENYIITLDSQSESAYFKEYSEERFTTSSFGFSLAFNNKISIGSVWNESPARAAGLKPGLELLSINGAEVKFTKEGIFRALSAMQGQTIELAWKGGSVKLIKKILIPVE